ncbi:hypothetical protein MtrunA17_Chr5g0426471 [Medicago truncatula]|uniref:Uncharacterized protein n=1 Tax=Medicago truncatula TaxID=3880 RepID=A0A396HUG8_MEDTR|nr:hypothetical protein MtrunA17_Chr5g0426471 [Medicago truncatula]
MREKGKSVCGMIGTNLTRFLTLTRVNSEFFLDPFPNDCCVLIVTN